MRWNKTSPQQQTNSETLDQQKSNSWAPVGPGKDRSPGPSQLNWKLYAGPIIKSEARYNWGEVEDIGDESTSNLKNLKLFLIMYSMKLLCLLSLAAQTPYNLSHFWCVKSDVIFTFRGYLHLHFRYLAWCYSKITITSRWITYCVVCR